MTMTDLTSALKIFAQEYRDGNRLDSHGWWVVYPDWLREDTEKIKSSWRSMGGHPFGDLRGFEFFGGPRYTYDPVADAWSVDESIES